ncbi:MAG TPA: DNA recombination protein RmuC [Chitinophagaceae bacterium]|jgi:DNA recombination protein RmuC|nr:DNA recombination protein RmuC [Chitinophagaceae bacterium]
MQIELTAIIILLIVLVILLIVFRPRNSDNPIQVIAKIDSLQSGLKEDFVLNRKESANLSKENRTELNDTLKDFKEELTQTLSLITQQNHQTLQQVIKTIEDSNKANRETLSANLKDFITELKTKFDELKSAQKELSAITVEQLEKISSKTETKLTALTQQYKDDNQSMRSALENAFKNFGDTFDKSVQSFNSLQKEKFDQLDNRQTKMMESNEKKLEEMRVTVDEKLQKTLNERLGQSFEMVGKQLESVQKGLGEMQALAQDVGGLKKVLSNVKMRGGIGEVQLAMLLEQVLAPEQYAANVKTKQDSSDLVEFAIKLPGRDEVNSVVWLPVDAKFPKDIYEQLQEAYETADPVIIETASKNMENVIKKMAKDIRDKYIDPPNTTDFAIMFLPFEGIYAEIVRKASLLDVLQREYKVIVTGPTTLAAILNSLQMGFRTLALQQRSSEVWKILGAVKMEFAKFGDLMGKAQKNLNLASTQIDELMGKRTRAINRKLQEAEALPVASSDKYLPQMNADEIIDNEEQ